MQRLGRLPSTVLPEEETFGDLMDELGDGTTLDAKALVRRLEAVRDRLTLTKPEAFLIERFHLSYFALVPTWSHYELLDLQLQVLGASIVLLVVSDDRLRDRSLLREEYDGADWQDFSTRFGSEDDALDALRKSQERRIQALGYSRMKHRIICTDDKSWDDYARLIGAP